MTRLVLLRPFLYGARNRFFPGGGMSAKTAGILLLAIAVCTVLFFVTCRVITYFRAQNELGIILSLKIFQMAWITLFAMLVFSCMISAVSSIFLTQDNEIVVSAPVGMGDIYFMRYWTTTVYTSWMIVVFTLPIFAAYGWVFEAGPFYLPLMTLSVLSAALTATGLAMLATIVLVRFFPARRTKDIVLILSLCFGIAVYVIFRMLRPEDLVDPERFKDFVEYLSGISRPTGPWLPASWAANLLIGYLQDGETDLLLLFLLLLTPVCLFFVGELAMDRFFVAGYTKSQQSFGGHRRFTGFYKGWGGYGTAIAGKEARTFFRDSAEWSQLFMIGALVVVYLYNFKVLPVDRSPIGEEYIANLIAFLNIGLSGFMVAALAARFVYPSISAEGGAFYHLRTSPLPLSRYLAAKYLLYVGPFTVLALLLIVVSNSLLRIEGPVWWASIVIGLVITWTVVAAALGLGAVYVDLKAESRAAVLGSMGAIVYLFAAMAYEIVVITIGALPVYRIMRRWLRAKPIPVGDWLLLAGAGCLIFAVSAWFALTVCRKGIRRLENL